MFESSIEQKSLQLEDWLKNSICCHRNRKLSSCLVLFFYCSSFYSYAVFTLATVVKTWLDTIRISPSWGSCTLKFFGKNISDNDRLCICLGHLVRCDTDRIINIGVMSPKVAKASTVVTVACRWLWQYHPKLCQWKYGFSSSFLGLLCCIYTGIN